MHKVISGMRGGGGGRASVEFLKEKFNSRVMGKLPCFKGGVSVCCLCIWYEWVARDGLRGRKGGAGSCQSCNW